MCLYTRLSMTVVTYYIFPISPIRVPYCSTPLSSYKLQLILRGNPSSTESLRWLFGEEH